MCLSMYLADSEKRRLRKNDSLRVIIVMADSRNDAPTVVKFSIPKLFLSDILGPGFDMLIHIVRSTLKGFEGSAIQIDPCFDDLFIVNQTSNFDSLLVR